MGSAQSTEARDSKAGVELNDLPRRLGRYTLLRRIAKGGMGEVLLAATLGLEGAERPVIIKMIRSEHRADASFKARFLDEARVQAQLGHSGIAQVLEATTDDATGEPYVAVEYVDGRSLGDLRQRALAANQKLAWHEAVAIAAMAAEALAHMHERRDASGKALAIVHRDLSPQNIMLSYAGELKVIDFGTARGQNRRCHTVAGVVFAKPGYVAPEVANGDPGDYRVDLYALGVMLWELIVGTRFLQGDAAAHMALVAKAEKELPPVASECGAPSGLDTILTSLTCFDRDKRYVETRLAARDLAALLGAAPVLPNGERGIRVRSAAVMDRFFPGESMKARREFLRLVAAARKSVAAEPTPLADASKDSAEREREVAQGMLPGTRYKLKKELGRGEGGVVHEAEHVDLGRKVAIKIAIADAEESDTAIRRLRREARALARVRSPGVVTLLDVGKTSDGRAFSVMELCEGEPLSRLIARSGPLEEQRALEIVKKALVVLEDIHAAGVIHRDLKPENLFVTRADDIKILDFGIALRGGSSGADETPRPKGTVELFGTPDYMAPEQVSSRADEQSDVYAMGTILYELLAGRLPFVAKGVALLLEAKAQGNPEPISSVAPERHVSKEAEAVVMKAMARHPSLRFASAKEMREAIEVALDAPGRRGRRRRVAAMGAVAAVVAFASVFAYAERAVVVPRAESALATVEARASALVHGRHATKSEAQAADADASNATTSDADDSDASASSDAASADPVSSAATTGTAVASDDAASATDPDGASSVVSEPTSDASAEPPPEPKSARKQRTHTAQKDERHGKKHKGKSKR